MRKIKAFLEIISDWHILSILGIVLLAYSVLLGYNPLVIEVPGYGAIESIKPSAEELIQGKRMYNIMRWGLLFALLDNLIRIPPIANRIKDWRPVTSSPQWGED